jgi:hypothetical protein
MWGYEEILVKTSLNGRKVHPLWRLSHPNWHHRLAHSWATSTRPKSRANPVSHPFRHSRSLLMLKPNQIILLVAVMLGDRSAFACVLWVLARCFDPLTTSSDLFKRFRMRNEGKSYERGTSTDVSKVSSTFRQRVSEESRTYLYLLIRQP